MKRNVTGSRSESRLPMFGTVYSIPADTHADLDLQDDKELALQSTYRRRGRRRYSFR